MHPSPIPPPYRTMQAADVPAHYVANINAAAAARGLGSVLTTGSMGTEVGLLVVGGLLVFGAAFLLATTSGSMTFREPAALVGGLALLGWGIFRLTRRNRSEIGTFILETDAYYIRSDGGILQVWSWAHASNWRITHVTRNASYQGSNLEVDFPGGAPPLVFGGRPGSDANLVEQAIAREPQFAKMRGHADRARAAAANGMWSGLDGANLLPA